MTAIIIVENLNCGGCENTIRRSLNLIKGVFSVKVDQGESTVEVVYSGITVPDKVKRKLKKIGYPEHGTSPGVTKTGTSAGSYVSCAIANVSERDRGKV
jgi:copper chaperone